MPISAGAGFLDEPSVTLSGMPSGKSSPTGFSSTPKPWSIEEQKDAVEEENRMRIEENKRLDALTKSL